MKTNDLLSSTVFAALAVIAGCGGEDAADTANGGSGGTGGDGGATSTPTGGGGGGIDTGGPGGGGPGGTGPGGTTTGGGSGGGSAPSCKAAWSRSFKGDITQQFITSLIPDDKGDIVVCGYFEGTMDTGAGELTSEASDMVLVKLDSAGNQVWTRLLGGPENQYGQVVSDGEGGLILTGQMEGSMDLGAGTLTSEGAEDAFIARFDADGKLLWNKRFGGPGHQSAGQARLDAKGDIVVIGRFEETIDLGGGPLTSAGNIDGYVAKFDLQGNHLWSKSFGDGSQQVLGSMDVDSAGNILLTGMFVGAMDFGGGPITTAGGFDVFVAKLDPDGGHVWSQRYGDSQIQTAAAVVVGPSDNVFVTGTFQGVIDFGGGQMLADPGLLGDMFVVELDAAGKHVQSHGVGGDAQRIPYAMALDEDGSPVVTGQFTGTLDVGGATLTSTSQGDYDAFVFKLDPAGKPAFAGRFGDAKMQVGEAVALAAPGQPILGGGFDGVIDFGAGPLENAPHDSPVDFDFFITRLDCNP